MYKELRKKQVFPSLLEYIRNLWWGQVCCSGFWSSNGFLNGLIETWSRILELNCEYSCSQSSYQLKTHFEAAEKKKSLENVISRGFPGGTVVKNPPANAGGTGLSPGPGRSHMPRSN